MSGIQQTNVVAVTDARRDSAGAIVYWALADEIDRGRLGAEWGADGHDEDLLPSETSAKSALGDAVRSLADARPSHDKQRILARPLGDGEGWALVGERPEANDLEYDTIVKARLDGDEARVEPAGHDLAGAILEAYDRKRATLAHGVVGRWLRNLGRMCKSTCLRPSGGMYFIPREEVGRFRDWVETFSAAAPRCTVYEILAEPTDGVVRAVLDAIAREADEEIGNVEEELSGRDLGVAALKRRETRCDGMAAKLEAYEELLGDSLDGIKERIEGLRGSVVEAAMLAEAGEKD